MRISIVIPAWNEACRLPVTLAAVQRAKTKLEEGYGQLEKHRVEVIVVDDGSRDETASAAGAGADLIIRMPKRGGKAAALRIGWKAAAGEIIVLLDADLEQSAERFPELLEPLLAGEADFAVARFPAMNKRGGFGLVKTLAAGGVRRLTGCSTACALSGQRAFRAEVLRGCNRRYQGFGIEVGMMIDAIRLGYRKAEPEIAFSHRETGRRPGDWLHRGRQFAAVGRVLWHCWRRPLC